MDPVELSWEPRPEDFPRARAKGRGAFWRFVVAPLAMAVFGAVGLGLGWEWALWPLLFGGTFVGWLLWMNRSIAGPVLRYLLARRRSTQASQGPYRERGAPQTQRVRVDAEGLQVQTNVGLTSIPWAGLSAVERCPGEGWRLHLRRGDDPLVLLVEVPERAANEAQGEAFERLLEAAVPRSDWRS